MAKPKPPSEKLPLGSGLARAVVRLGAAILGRHQIGAHEPQHLSRLERQPGNPGIVPRTKDLGEQILLEGHPPVWRLVTDKEMRFPPPGEKLRLLVRVSLRRDEVPGWQFWNRRRLRIILMIVPGHDIQAPGFRIAPPELALDAPVNVFSE